MAPKSPVLDYGPKVQLCTPAPLPLAKPCFTPLMMRPLLHHWLESILATTMSFCTDYKGKDKLSTGVFLDTIYSDLVSPNEHIDTEIIWSDGPSSEFKNQYMCFLIQELSKKHGKPFIWKFSATSLGKGVFDGVGGKIK